MPKQYIQPRISLQRLSLGLRATTASFAKSFWQEQLAPTSSSYWDTNDNFFSKRDRDISRYHLIQKSDTYHGQKVDFGDSDDDEEQELNEEEQEFVVEEQVQQEPTHEEKEPTARDLETTEEEKLSFRHPTISRDQASDLEFQRQRLKLKDEALYLELEKSRLKRKDSVSQINWDRSLLLDVLDCYRLVSYDGNDIDSLLGSPESTDRQVQPQDPPNSGQFESEKNPRVVYAESLSQTQVYPQSNHLSLSWTTGVDISPGNGMSDGNLMKQLIAKVERLEAENQSLRSGMQHLRSGMQHLDRSNVPEESTGPRWQTVYRLDSTNLSISEPTWHLWNGKPSRLKAGRSITNFDLYLEKNRSIEFIIFKDYQSSQESPEREDEQATTADMWELPAPDKETIKLVSSTMKSALKEYLALVPGFYGDFPAFSVEGELHSPYQFWYCSREGFDDRCGNLDVHHQTPMSTLHQWIEANYQPLYQQIDTELAQGLISEVSAMYHFRPGTAIVSHEQGQTKAYVCRTWAFDMRSEWRSDKDEKIFVTNCNLECWAWGFDGLYFVSDTTLNFQLKTKGRGQAIKVQEPTIYPINYADHKVEAMLRYRGKTHWSCRNARLVEYDGDSYHGATLDGQRFMVDFEMYRVLHPTDTALKKHSRNHKGQKIHSISEDTGPEGDEIYLFPSRVKGFSFRSKKWMELDVDIIRDVQWHKTAFDNLVIPPKSKELIEALVTTELTSEQSTDIIPGKGNGLIMLLHGGPGTGKTFTAETVAEFSEKPLYRVTCGDIGTVPEQVEEYLESVLYLGKKWGCVVLLDEADVFLEERGLQDLQRNALVSVFLRLLEYYEGILILTSNRVGTFDEAFKSRIQLALHYKNLTVSQRKKIWRNFVNWLKEIGETEAVDLDDIIDHLDELAQHPMNGRQIRNSITTARQLAKFKKRVMSYEDLDHVISISGEFDKYLMEVKEGLPDEDIARADSRR